MEKFITKELLSEVRERFHAVDYDKYLGKRLFFENSGGSLRLKSVIEKEAEIAALPDCSLRNHQTAKELFMIQEKGIEDIRLLLNAKGGSILTGYTASMIMFEMVRAVLENIAGSNVVTSSIEHPSAFDSMKYYAEKTDKELRIVKANPVTGGIDVESVKQLVDKDTCLVNIMSASNITGANTDIEAIVKAVRAIKPDVYVIVDCVQYAPHGVIDVEKWQVDGVNIAPYKFFGNRGFAIGYASERLAMLPHNKLSAKESKDWELGSSTPADFVAISEVIKYITWLGKSNCTLTNKREEVIAGMKVIKGHEQALLRTLLEGNDCVQGLREMDGVTVHFDTEDLSKRSLILALTFDHLDCSSAVKRYEEKGIVVYERLASSSYSKRILDSFDLEGVVRVSPLHCNNIDDIEKFLITTKEIINGVS